MKKVSMVIVSVVERKSVPKDWKPFLMHGFASRVNHEKKKPGKKDFL